ncbi:hypothetical protein L596_022852 [Steinernema carpocapsae]|uniref:PDZ domain-containing protein n=1 Tax=Steinernema carpocapsae TaxID=34508 RepID=A0A4U5MN03_STECR|nr:hypothetical protein L596_022852 [Steinernema carpocapsae]
MSTCGQRLLGNWSLSAPTKKGKQLSGGSGRNLRSLNGSQTAAQPSSQPHSIAFTLGERSDQVPLVRSEIFIVLCVIFGGRSKMSACRSVEQNSLVQHQLGHPPQLPASFVQEVSVEMQFQPEEKIGITVSKRMVVIKMDQQSATNKLFLCDFITHVNEVKIESKLSFYGTLHAIIKAEMRRPQILDSSSCKRSDFRLVKTASSFTLTVQRPIWNSPTNNLPNGYDRPAGYQYFTGLFVLYPGSVLGIGIKAYNSKVYVSHTEQNSLSSSTCYIGDCIVAIGQVPVTSTADAAPKSLTASRRNSL